MERPSPKTFALNPRYFSSLYPFNASLVYTIQRYIWIALLFTWTDYKTIFLPVAVFGCAVAPVHSWSHLLRGLAWIWIHLLLCNVSNQARSEDEDALNRPWRPLPSGLVTRPQAVVLRHATVLICMLWSSSYGMDLVGVTAGLIATTWLYDEGGLSKSVVGKNLCNVAGYMTFEIGATKVMGASRHLDSISTTAAVLSGALIFTTIQAQDFPDVEGDVASGRMTFPVYAPEFSRLFTLFAIVGWSMGLGWYWNAHSFSQAAFVSLGLYVGLRYYLRRTVEADRKSYIVYNIWLLCAHLLPLHARFAQAYGAYESNTSI